MTREAQHAVTAAIVSQVIHALAPDCAARMGSEADRAFFIDTSVEGLAAYAQATSGLDEAAVRRGVAEDFAPTVLTVLTLASGRPIGVVVVEARPAELWLDQIVVAPAHQRRGIGSRVLRALHDVASARGEAIALSVLAGNPARELYARLGFVVERVAPPRTYMRWA